MKLYFISDLHLGGDTPEKESAKLKLLATFFDTVLDDSKRLIIIGDLFDFWFEYKSVIQKEHFDVLALLKSAINRGLEITYLAGNHDFSFGKFLTHQIGMQVHMDSHTLKFDNKIFFLTHGDGIAKRDTGYRLWKKVFRFNPNIFLYRWFHPDLGVPFAKWISGSSRKYSATIDLHDGEDYIDHAKQHIDKGADFVLMGHRHNPIKHIFPEKKVYVNTGDWLQHFTYAVYENGDINLFDLKNEFEKILNTK